MSKTAVKAKPKSAKPKRTMRLFKWCKEHGLVTNKHIALAFSVSVQTVRNWRHGGDAVLKPWVWLACAGYEIRMGRSKGPLPALPKMTFEWFQEWMTRNGLESFSEAGVALGLSRQAVHNWFRRNRFPNWVALACLGFERQTRGPVQAKMVAKTWLRRGKEAASQGGIRV